MDFFSLEDHSLYTQEMIVLESPSSAVDLAPTAMPHSKLLKSSFFPVLISYINENGKW